VKADELVVEKGSERATVRMKGIHAFGSINYDEGLKALGAQSKALVRDALVGKDIQVELGVPPKDEHGRYLGYVKLEGVDQNRRLIEIGQAVVYTEYAFEREADYKEAEKGARQAKSALWGRPDAVELIENLRGLWSETRQEMPSAPSR